MGRDYGLLCFVLKHTSFGSCMVHEDHYHDESSLRDDHLDSRVEKEVPFSQVSVRLRS